MLKKKPALALAGVDVTDHAGRNFTNITGFQYAVWALDWHMWRMIRRYLPIEAAKEQALGFTNGPWVGTHGEHANWQDLLDALQECIDNMEHWNFSQLASHWLQKVGVAQKNLPMHVFQEYLRPDRAFVPCPDFTDMVAFPRKPLDHLSKSMLSTHHALGRNDYSTAVMISGQREAMVRKTVKPDLTALTELFRVRIQQRAELIAELTRNIKLRPRG